MEAKVSNQKFFWFLRLVSHGGLGCSRISMQLRLALNSQPFPHLSLLNVMIVCIPVMCGEEFERYLSILKV